MSLQQRDCSGLAPDSLLTNVRGRSTVLHRKDNQPFSNIQIPQQKNAPHSRK
jgi:hypothetical protein